MPELNLEGGRVAYLDGGGDGPAVVLLHAGASSGRQWGRVAERLADRFRVVAPDLWGFGDTDAWPGAAPLAHDHQAALVAAVVEDAGLGPVHLVGHSYGGAAAVRLALGDPRRVRTLVLIEPILPSLLQLAGEEEAFGEYRDMAHAFIDHAAAGRNHDAWQGFIDYRNGPGTWAGLTERTRERFASGTANAVAGMHSNLGNPTTLADLASLTAPTLVLCGENTTAPDRRITEILHAHVPGSRYAIIAGAEHMSPASHPGFIADAIRAHVAGA